MKNLNWRRALRSIMWLSFAGLFMGNESCQKKTPPPPEGRQLRRRVIVKPIAAPEIELPEQYGRKKFDFAYAANMQLYDILRKTQSFTTATFGDEAEWDPDKLSQGMKDRFNQCDDDQIEPLNYNMRTQAYFSGGGEFSRRAYCAIYMPQAVVEGSVTDFALVSSRGVSLGLLQIPGMPTGEFSFDKFMISLDLSARHIHEKGKQPFSTVSMDRYVRNQGTKLKMNFGALALGFSNYFRTPLRTVVDESLTDAVKRLRDNWNEQEPWYAMVLKNCDDYVYINGGYGNDVGLKIGDILEIRNVIYEWEDRACESRLNRELPKEIVSYARVKQVGRNISEAEIINDDPVNYPRDKRYVIFPGARAYMKKMVEQVEAEKNTQPKP
jgi:hypothetical protein